MIEHRISVKAPASVIFDIYKDVAHWHTWDPDTKLATLNGPFAVGASGTLAPTKGRPIRIGLTAVCENQSFTAEGGVPGFRMSFEHELSSLSAANTEVIHRVKFFGVLAFMFKRVLGPQINAGLPITLGRLKELAESRARSGS
jgi:hypothetical protein